MRASPSTEGLAVVDLDRGVLSRTNSSEQRRAIAQIALTLTLFTTPDGGIGQVSFTVDGDAISRLRPGAWRQQRGPESRSPTPTSPPLVSGAPPTTSIPSTSTTTTTPQSTTTSSTTIPSTTTAAPSSTTTSTDPSVVVTPDGDQ